MSNSSNNRKRKNSNHSIKGKLISAHYLYKNVVIDVQSDAELFHQSLINAVSRDNEYYLRVDFHAHYISELETLKKKSDSGLEFSNSEKVIFCLNVYALSTLKIIPQDNSNGILLIHKV